MRALLVGAKGMLGSAVHRAVPSGVELGAVGHTALDITDHRAVERLLDRERPEFVINCAGYTKVDEAEARPDDAYRVNTVGAIVLAHVARRMGTSLLHVSTDYVFDGKKSTAYREEDAPNPLNVYGWSKLAGEQAVRNILPERHLIVRTQWLFGAGGGNFLATILRLARTRPKVTVVDDQFGSPTYTGDLATALWRLVVRRTTGTVHVANSGVATWFEVAREVVAISGLGTIVEPCPTADMPRPAKRPAYSVLDCARYVAITGEPLRDWKAGVSEYLRSLLRDDRTMLS